MQVGLRRPPGIGIDRLLVAGADVLHLVAAVGLREPDERDATALRGADLLAELLGRRRDLARDAASPEGGRDGVARGPAVVVDDGDEDGARHRSRAGEDAVGDERHQGAGDAERDADAGVRRLPVAGEGVVAAAAADRLQVLVAGHEDLDHGAGVVVEAPRDAQVRLDRDVAPLSRAAALDDGGELGQALVEQAVLHPERPHLVDERGVGGADRGERQALLCLLDRGPALRQLLGDGFWWQLVELVDGADRGHEVGDPEAAVEALDQLAVVELEAQRRQRQLVERLHHHPHHLDVVVERQHVAADDVDVGLGELAVAADLRPLPAPRGLDLEAPERELEVAGVLEHVAGERHREVEVQTQSGVAGVVVGGLEPTQHVDLLVDLAALGQPVQRLDHPGLDVGEAVQREGARQRRDDLALDDALRGQQLGEPAERGDSGHVSGAGRRGRPAARAGRGWWRARRRSRSARRGRAAPRRRRRA